DGGDVDCPLVQVWQVQGGQYKYTSHISNFPRETAVFHAKVPILPEQVDVIIMHRKGQASTLNLALTEDFCVRRAPVQQWFKYLMVNHPTFQSNECTVDFDALNQLPEDRSIYDCLHDVDGDNPGDVPETPLYSQGFVPAAGTWQNEIEQLQAAALNSDEPVILTVPLVHGTPINENSQTAIAMNAFPTLRFPSGQANYTATCSTAVTMSEWASHLIRLEGGRFTCHPQFCYGALNTILWDKAWKEANWY
ncbi:hypothetical protein K435DRAFT_636221, partial [Dendrothele bispora CBS 962.96]